MIKTIRLLIDRALRSPACRGARAACGILAIAGCLKSQPERPIEIKLVLAKPRMQAGEYLWYRVEMKNIGRKPIPVEDPFWCRQEYFGQTDVEIIGPDGEKVFARRMPWGRHHEHKFWTNDFGGDGLCTQESRPPTRPLRGGETWVATPSKVSDVRPLNPHVRFDPGDARALSETPKGWSPQQIEELKKKWKDTVEQSGYLYGDPTFLSTSAASAVERLHGYRVLDVYSFDKPGKYRMRIVYAPFGRHATMRGEESRLKANGETIEEFLTRWGWPKETRVLNFESNWTEFEIFRAPFPKHLFNRNKAQTPQQKKLAERLERQMRESGDWLEPAPSK